MNRHLIVADDLTGANDSGLQLRRKGFVTYVHVGRSSGKMTACDALVLDSESRNASEEEAVSRVRATLAGIDADSFSTIMKKVDSTLRGNIVAEVLEVADFCKASLIVVSPAYPDQGRTVEEGRLLVKGVPLLEGESGRDPRKPVIEDNLVNLFSSRQDEFTVFHLKAGEAFPKVRQKTLLVCDASTQDDLCFLVSLASRMRCRVLFVGSAGMADAIIRSRIPSCGVLGMVASLSEETRKQVCYAKEHQLCIREVSVKTLLEGGSCSSHIRHVMQSISEGKPVLVVVTSVLDHLEYSKSVEIGRDRGLSADAVAERIKSSFSVLGKTLVESCDLCGLFLSGGDIAFGVLEALGINEVEIQREVDVGIPLMKVPSGRHADMRIVTKAGAFGNEEAIVRAMRVLQER